jgi:hypothetical protein
MSRERAGFIRRTLAFVLFAGLLGDGIRHPGRFWTITAVVLVYFVAVASSGAYFRFQFGGAASRRLRTKKSYILRSP